MKHIVFLGFLLLSLTVVQAQESVNIMTWHGMSKFVDAQRFDSNSAAKGFTIGNVTSASEIEIRTKIKAEASSNGSEIDIVDLDISTAKHACDEGFLLELDVSLLEPGAQGSAASDDFAPGTISRCGVGVSAWSLAYAYLSKLDGQNTPSSPLDFFDLNQFPGLRGMNSGPKYNLEIALMADEVPPSEVYNVLSTKDGLERALAKLSEIKDDIVWWDEAQAPIRLLADGVVAMTTAYSTQIAPMLNEGPPVDVFFKGQIWSHEVRAVPKGSQRKEAALNFLKFSTSTDQMVKQRDFGLPAPTRYSADYRKFQCSGGSCPCSGQSICSKKCCNSSTKEMFEQFGLKYSDTFWENNIGRIAPEFADWMSK